MPRIEISIYLLCILFLIGLATIKITYADYPIYENFTFNPSQNNITYRMNRTFEGMTVIEINETCLTLNTSIWCNSSATSKEINISDMGFPIILNLRNTSTTNQSSYIEWSCNENCNYTLHLFNNSLRTNENIFDIRYNNTFNLSRNPHWNNLTNSTSYFVNLTVWDNSGNSAINNTFNFTTASNILIVEAEISAPSAGHEGGTGLGTEIGTAEISEVTLARYGYPCPTDIPFFKRLFSRCIVANNGICDDGEWFLMSKDCELSNILFFSMWFLRIIITISILFLVKNNKFFPIITVFLLILFYLNGAFPLLEKELTMPESPELKSPCVERSPFSIIFSNCKIPDNNICDYGEYPFINKECNPTTYRILFGKIFEEIWFIRFLIFIWIILLITKQRRYLPICTIILISLMATNTDITNSMFENRGQCEGLNYLINIGACISSNYPPIGYVLNGTSPIMPESIIETKEICKAENPFSMIFSTCKIANNGVCDYGEYPFIDADCKLTTNKILFGRIFEEMWLLRVLLVLSIIFLIGRKNNYLLFSSILLIGLLATNPDIVNLLFNAELSCEGINYIYNFGGCIAPSYPLLGWMLGLIIILVTYFIIRGIISAIKKPKRKVKT